VMLHPVAEATRTDVAPPPRAAVAVQAASGLLARHGTVQGALAIVLDCSGSAGPPPGREMDESTRHPPVLRAMRGILARVPRGTTVSVWTFGQAVGTARTAVAEETIQRAQAPVLWKGEREQIDSVMSTVEGLQPWNESPVVRAILRAREDLTRA